MKVMVLVKATPESEAGVMPEAPLLTEMMAYNEQLVKAGIMLAGDGLHPSSKGARVRFSGKDRTVIDGPFAETKELVAGYWMWQVQSLAEAIEWVKRCPNPMLSDSEIEIRPVFELADFGDAVTPEVAAQHQRVAAESEKLSQSAASQPAADAIAPPRFEETKPRIIAGLQERYSLATRMNIPMQWQRFAPRLGKVPGQVGGVSYGVCFNSDPDCNFDYLCGVEVEDESTLPADMAAVKIPAARFAVFEHRGALSSIGDTLQAIWGQWLPASGHQTADLPCFERYSEDFNPQTGAGGVEIWIPLKA